MGSTSARWSPGFIPLVIAVVTRKGRGGENSPIQKVVIKKLYSFKNVSVFFKLCQYRILGLGMENGSVYLLKIGHFFCSSFS